MKLKFLFVFLVFASVFAATRADDDVAAPIEDNGNCHRGIGAFFHHLADLVKRGKSGEGPKNDCPPGLVDNDNGNGPPERRRRLPRIDLSSLLEDHYNAMCFDKDYRLSLFVDTHIQLIAEPLNGGTNTNLRSVRVNPDTATACPTILLHQFKTIKEVVDVEERKDYYTATGAGLDLGIFHFGAIVEAWSLVESRRNAEYDIIRNNCGTVVLRMMNKLGIDIDADELAVARYISAKLYEHGKIVKQLNESPHLIDVIPKGQDPSEYTDKALVELLVLDNVKNFDKDGDFFIAA